MILRLIFRHQFSSSTSDRSQWAGMLVPGLLLVWCSLVAGRARFLMDELSRMRSNLPPSQYRYRLDVLTGNLI